MRARHTRQTVGRKIKPGHLIAWVLGTALHSYAGLMAIRYYRRNPNG